MSFTQNQLYSCGYNTWHQNLLGNSSNSASFISHPQTPVFEDNVDDDKVIDVALGAEYSLALLESGRCYAGGLSAYGQLGFMNEASCSTSHIIKQFQFINKLSHVKVAQIDCGAEHSCFLTDQGRVYLCGYNYHQEISTTNTNVYEPVEILSSDIFGSEEPERIVRVVAGSWHTCFVTESGNVYARGQYIEYGKDTSSEYIRINGNIVVDKLKCGEYFSLMRDKNSKELYILSNNTGLTLVPVPGETICDFDCRDRYFVLLDQQSQITIYHRELTKGITHVNVDNVSSITTSDQKESATRVSLSSTFVAIVYPSGNVRVYKYTPYHNSATTNEFEIQQWIRDVSAPRCSNMGTELVAVAGYNHFMFYWKQNVTRDVINFYHKLSKQLSDGTNCDIAILFHH